MKTEGRVRRGVNKMPKPGRNDKKVYFLIAGEELSELQRHTRQMTEAFGLDRRIENYQGKKPIGFYSWDMECLLCVMENALEDDQDYPDKNSPGFKAFENLYKRMQEEYSTSFG